VRKIEHSFLFRTLIAASLVFFAACQPGGEEPSESTPSPAASDFTVEVVDFDGLQAALAEYRGEGMLLNFWAMWCAPCVAELPDLNEIAQAYREKGGKVVAVSYDLMLPGADSSTIVEETREFLVKRGIDIPILIYDADDYNEVNEFYSLPGEVPVTLALNAAGEIVDREDSSSERARFEELMKKAMGL